MKIEIDSTEINDKDFAQKNSEHNERWFVRTQPILLFKSGSKYPDKGQLTLSFSDNEIVRDKVSTLPKGVYELSDSAFYFDSNGNFKVALKPDNLKLVSVKTS